MLVSEEGSTYMLHSGLAHTDWLSRILRAGNYVPLE
jgi:hypothetical protein